MFMKERSFKKMPTNRRPWWGAGSGGNHDPAFSPQTEAQTSEFPLAMDRSAEQQQFSFVTDLSGYVGHTPAETPARDDSASDQEYSDSAADDSLSDYRTETFGAYGSSGQSTPTGHTHYGNFNPSSGVDTPGSWSARYDHQREAFRSYGNSAQSTPGNPGYGTLLARSGWYNPGPSPAMSSHLGTPDPEREFVVPVRGSETPMTLANNGEGGSTPYVEQKLSRARRQDVQDAALRMYKVLKEHGLAAEAHKAFEKRDDSKSYHKAASDSFGLDGGDDGEELVGMDYILKDGIVNYLCDVAKITPPLPRQVVRFHDINYYTETQPAPLRSFETFGDKMFKCFFGLCARPFQKKEAPRHLDILKDITGYIMPGSMTLLLGPPGSGKSSLLKVLAGRAETNKTTHLEGTILFNDREASEILLTRLIAYVNGQLNQHLPFLTVRETLEFAGNCSQGMKPDKFTAPMRKFFAQALVEGQDPYLEYVLHSLGLKDIEHQLVGSGGNGISEDDLNRLTTAEIAMGTYSVMLYDQPCFGQDSLATYELVSTLRAIGRFQQCSAVMSLVQLSPEVFDLFDRVILLGKGQILYQGPRQDVLHYFARLGFNKPLQMDPSDFLMELAAGEGSQYLESGYGNPGLAHLAMSYKLSDAGKDVRRIVHSQDVIHALWVESEQNLSLSVRKKEQSTTIDQQDGKLVMSRSNSSAADVEVVISKLSPNIKGGTVRGIESSGTVVVGDLVTGLSLPNEDMFYVNVTQSKNDKRSRASNLASMLANARGHVRLQVERIRDPMALEQEEVQAPGHFSRKFIQTWLESTVTLIKRQLIIYRRTVLLILLRLLQVLVMGLFAGALFHKTGGRYNFLKMNAVRSLGFVTTGNLMLVSLVQLQVFMMQRPSFYKQRQQRFFRPSSYIVSQSVVGIPQSLIESVVYAIPVYFLVGLYLGDGGFVFLQYILTLFVVSCFGSSLVLTLSGLAAILEQANALAGLLVALFLLYSGFMIYPSDMPAYWRWLADITPLRWANTAFCAVQFERLYPELCTEEMVAVEGIFFCRDYPGKSVGLAFMFHYEIKPGQAWYWTAIAIITGWTIVMNFLAYIVYKKIHHVSVTPSLPSQSDNVDQSISTYTRVETTDETAGLASISWAGFVVQGDVDLQNEFPTKSPGGPRTLQKMMEQGCPPGRDLEYCNSISPDQHSGEEFSWRSSSIAVVRTTLSFYNVTFKVKNPKASKVTKRLDNVSGYAKPGRMLAIMGGKKSGSSTLLKCLANRGLQNGQVSGEILFNGSKLNSATLSRTLGFVERLDAHQPYLTIRESLIFSASLRLPKEVKKDDMWLHIDLILDLLELELIADRLVGSLRGSTGKTFELAKKITIAVELAANPSILLLEEPTSGLDGLGARNVIHAIQTVAASGRTIITTIQHPSSRMLSAFQSVILLSNKGEQVYFGPVGSNCSQMLEYFNSIPEVPKYDMKKNPVTHVFDLLGCGIKTRDPIYDFTKVYRHTLLAIRNKEELKLLRTQNKRKALKLESSEFAASFHKQAITVIVRTQKFLWRNVGYTFGRVVSGVAVGLMLGWVYFQIPQDNGLDLTSRSLFIYIQVMLLGVVTANNVVPQLGTDRLAYFRERRAAMYSPILYPISWALAELPYLLIQTLILVATGNALAGIGTDTASNFFIYWMSLYVFTISMAYFSMLITIATPVPMVSSFIVSICTSLWITACGVVVTLPIFNKSWLWTYWTNPFQYVINTLTSVSFYCDVSTPQCSRPQCEQHQPCPGCGCAQLKDLYYYFSWTFMETYRGIDYQRIPRDFAFLTGVMLLFATLAFIAFVAFKHNKP